MSSGKNKLLEFFLSSSPLAQKRKLEYILTLPQNRRYFMEPTVSDHTYTRLFLTNLEPFTGNAAFVESRLPPLSN